MKTKIILAFLVAALASCSFRLTPDGGKEVSIDGIQAAAFVKTLLDAKTARNVQP